jgi:O-6-methylguanine DNA methyltransferase
MSVFDLYREVYRLVKQIPEGQISTYKEIAIALGDEIAARAIGEVLNQNPFPIEVPCHRVVHEDMRIGGYRLALRKRSRF